MGIYRFLLSIFVAISHAGVLINGLNPGVIAVISFLIISGYVMTALIYKNYFEPKKIAWFYLDRIFRIYPQYLFNIITVLIIYYNFGLNSHYLSQPSQIGLLQNLLIIPMGFYMIPWVGEKFMIIPPAWSLGLEGCFYLLIPFILIYKLEKIFFWLSYIIFLMAYLGIIHTDYFGYRLIFGTIFIFICGSFLYKNNNINTNQPVKFTLIFSCLLLAATFLNSRLILAFNREVLTGLILGIISIHLLIKIKRTYLDDFFGNLSYGLFLSHYLVIFEFEQLKIHWNFKWILVMLLTSIFLSGIGFFCFEKPVIALRKKIRKQHN
ncbi:acyltransferase family protein [uncultured Nostoc sp.]|uniref:acyltransferase family protein n=1 Tax=uncultured Nostoc sp. TaxID=340711 RepID=UPI0035C9B23F